MRTLAIVSAVICVGLLAGCGGSQRASGYLYRYGNGESFIQWQQQGRHVHGTIETTQSSATSPFPVGLVEHSATLNGTVSGSSVSLHFSSGARISGTLHSYGLLLSSCPPCGVGVRYRRASVADYDVAAAQTEATVQRLRKRQSAAQAGTSAGP